MIGISNLTVSTKAPAGTVVGKLSLLDNAMVGLSPNFILTKNAAGFFAISGSNLVTVNTSIPAGFYSVRVRAVATKAWMSDEAVFGITVTTT